MATIICPKCLSSDKFRMNDEWHCHRCGHSWNNEREKSVNTKYTWAQAYSKSDKQFLMFIWARLHEFFGEREDLDYMKRLDTLIEKTPGNHRMDIVDDKKWDIYRKGKLIWSDPNE